ncbi:hypothetical protein ACFW1P_14130 [Paenibacillus sp. NPDC058910]|uniref:hypothetical protein n=1 Tax=unclassified Paenibacillus TaxID=185978 RepID=UPI003693A666
MVPRRVLARRLLYEEMAGFFAAGSSRVGCGRKSTCGRKANISSRWDNKPVGNRVIP